jgi:hypothetical protein
MCNHSTVFGCIIVAICLVFGLPVIGGGVVLVAVHGQYQLGFVLVVIGSILATMGISFAICIVVSRRNKITPSPSPA